jgi:hypothetical protein
MKAFSWGPSPFAAIALSPSSEPVSRVDRILVARMYRIGTVNSDGWLQRSCKRQQGCNQE